MRFSLPQPKNTAAVALRRAGYAPWTERGDEASFIRRVSGGLYPRYHLYVKEAGDLLELNLHLDQKKPSYAGSHAHSGEYDGPLIEAEAQRIRGILGV